METSVQKLIVRVF